MSLLLTHSMSIRRERRIAIKDVSIKVIANKYFCNLFLYEIPLKYSVITSRTEKSRIHFAFRFNRFLLFFGNILSVSFSYSFVCSLILCINISDEYQSRVRIISKLGSDLCQKETQRNKADIMSTFFLSLSFYFFYFFKFSFE